MAVVPSAKEGGRHGDSDRRRSPQGDERRRVEIDEQGELVGQETFPANRKGLRDLQRWAKRFPERRWAVEGAGGGIGRPLAQKLLAAGERVVDVSSPSSLLAGEGTLDRQRPKERCAGRYLHRPRRSAKRSAGLGPTRGWSGRPRRNLEILRLLTERREDLVCERTRALRTASTYSPPAGPPLRSCR